MPSFKTFVLILIFLALQLLILSNAHAEYRVFLLGIKDSPAQKQESQVITSLDDIQYSTYFKTNPNSTIRLIDHWMCWGRTNDFRKYCGRPVRQVASQIPQPRLPQKASPKVLTPETPVQSPRVATPDSKPVQLPAPL